MNIYIQRQVISKEYLKDDLILFASFDEDASGNNEEFTLKEAIEAGFKSNAEYWADLADKKLKETGDLDEAIRCFMHRFEKSWVNYCEHCSYDTDEDITTDGTLLMFAYLM